jgi:hypothetical protein
MGNMPYCRFENTTTDLRDCLDYMDDNDLSENEQGWRKELIKICVDIACDYGNCEECE